MANGEFDMTAYQFFDQVAEDFGGDAVEKVLEEAGRTDLRIIILAIQEGFSKTNPIIYYPCQYAAFILYKRKQREAA